MLSLMDAISAGVCDSGFGSSYLQPGARGGADRQRGASLWQLTGMTLATEEKNYIQVIVNGQVESAQVSANRAPLRGSCCSDDHLVGARIVPECSSRASTS